MAFARRAILFAFLWWILREGTFGAPLVAAAFVGMAAAASLVLQPPGAARWRPDRLPRLAADFVWLSILGGLDVSRRALAPALPVRPVLMRLELALPAGFPTVLFAWLVSLTPGTVSVRLHAGALTVHVLDAQMPAEKKLRALESRIAALFE